MFAGIDEVDWASMEHAYGPAGDVPAMLRGLASADPAERETALDGMYGAVHHQGDVYACTLASIPFLFELVVDPGIQDRGSIVELLTSIGGIDLDEDDEDEIGEDEFEGAANYAMAATAVTAGAGVFFELMADEDPGVRLNAPLALAALHGHPDRVLALLRERLPIEPDEEVRLALVEAAGRVALRHRALAGQSAAWLSRLAGEGFPAGLRLAALAQLARCAPDALPGDVVRVVTGLLRQLRSVPARRSGTAPAVDAQTGAAASAEAVAAVDAYPEAAGEPPAEERVAPVARVGQLRALSGEETPAPTAPWTADLLRTLHIGLDDRVAERTALLTDQLRSPDHRQRIDALRMCSGLIRTWRGSYEELVRLVGEQLATPEPRLAEAASHVLEELFGLAAPAADALAARVAADPGAWVRDWPSGPPALGSAVKALARLGDARAVPALAAALERPEVPHDVGFAIGCLGAAAAPLAELLRRRLGEVPLDERVHDRAGPLLTGLAALRADEALGEVLRVLRGAPEFRGEWLRTEALRALGSFGPAARGALPELRALLRSPGATSATETAKALWAVEGDADAVLPVLIEGLRAERVHELRSAVNALGGLGVRAAVVAPRLRALLGHDEQWLRVDAAVALWDVSGRAQESVPVLLADWEKNHHVRIRVAEGLARMGAAGAGSDAARVLRAELTSVRRHNAMDGVFGSHDTYEDEQLLALCRQALLRDTGKGPTT
ncbi:HEAT repeat domain-containing protein [Streptomyces sp. NBC_00257]|uniref:HEAT repeat domain-containing protein n=1 Tax=unclassified Streptomyces TaxID=2593676 RepID=UPI0022509731|nr:MULTISPECIES: HEAT repeat domain-containing protein [unclassified Streptomyces]MCX5429007.1 HEAT repeat domain-containing protein [Streptomyces sp. NBC_00062]